jgi:hypothetical protein
VKPICTVCGRRTKPFVMLGTEPIGPKCAVKAGLTPGKAAKGSRLTFTRAKPGKKNEPRMGDLFEGIDNAPPLHPPGN